MFQSFKRAWSSAAFPGEVIDLESVRELADEFSNAVLVSRDGRVSYVLKDAPDALASLRGELARSYATVLGEDEVTDPNRRRVLEIEQTFCHDALITAVLRLDAVLGSYVLLCEYIWMSRVLPLLPESVSKIIDTHDVFSTKKDKVLRFGVDDICLSSAEEASFLERADLVIAIQEHERTELQRLVPTKPVVTAGVDFDIVAEPGTPAGRGVLYVASDNAINRRALQDFLRFAWPTIRAAAPDAELFVAGRIGSTIAVDTAGVTYTGPVEDLAPLYQRARLVINPAVAGTGLKIKTLEAIGHLRPVVTFPSGAEGLPPKLASSCVLVSDWYDFARKVVELLGADVPPIISALERETLDRLMSPTVVYADLLKAVAAVQQSKGLSE